MRLWSLHPEYLDARGLVALWREALLAQAVLEGKTRGYTRHPQLFRFRESPSPIDAISHYLQAVYTEVERRGYSFDAMKINTSSGGKIDRIEITQGQMDFEFEHLKAKLKKRDPSRLADLETVTSAEPHPLFRIVPGEVQEWEIMPERNRDEAQ
ncbi:MAG: pyrimidine dimer DNA glycosylase/endonuclease V [Thermoleophilia bacterium]